jgi:hypothetical protein
MGGMCGGETDEHNELDAKHQEEEHEGEESEEEGKESKGGKKKPKQEVPDNKPFERMKPVANPRAWEAFCKDLHKPTEAEKRAGVKKIEATEQKNKDWYRGTVDAKGKYEGWGVWVNKKTGDIYQGEFAKGKPEGKGTMFFGKGKIEGNAVSGDFKAGKPLKGKGNIIFPNGDIWDGEIDNKGIATGSGVLQEKNGTKYEGQMKLGFKNDKRAKETSKEGNIYEGGFKAGMKDGKGKTTTKGGQPKYQQWQKGVIKKDIDEATWRKG